MTSYSPARSAWSKARLRGGCAAIGAALAFGLAVSAQAQVNGGYIPSPIGQPIINPSAGTVIVGNENTLIKWTPPASQLGAPSVFLDANNTLSFTAGEHFSGNYTVLNQFVTTDGAEFPSAIEINGTVTSSAGGNIWFQNSGGIIVGQTGRFDVGALVLTTRDIEHNLEDAGSGYVSGSLWGEDGSIRFGGETPASDSSNPNIGLIRNSGVINATTDAALSEGVGSSNYVAIVASNVATEASSVVTANGSIAYVAAEAATIRINDGLFDIEVTTGTGSANPSVISHFGQTLASASNGNQNIYMVAMPKDKAVSMLVGGTLTNQATSAESSGGDIILSAGSNIYQGEIQPAESHDYLSDITLSAGGVQDGRIMASASGDIIMTAAGTLTNLQELRLEADGRVTVDTELSLPTGYIRLHSYYNDVIVSKNLSADMIRLRAGNDVNVTGTQTANTLSILAGNDISLTKNLVANDVFLLAQNNITAENITSTESLYMFADEKLDAGTITASGHTAILYSENDSVSVDFLDSSADVILRGYGVTVADSTDLNLLLLRTYKSDESNGDASITSRGSISVTNGYLADDYDYSRVEGNLKLISGGDLFVESLVVGLPYPYDGGEFPPNETDGLPPVSAPTPSTAYIEAAGDMSLYSTSVDGHLETVSGGTLIVAAVDAQSMSLTSADIAFDGENWGGGEDGGEDGGEAGGENGGEDGGEDGGGFEGDYNEGSLGLYADDYIHFISNNGSRPTYVGGDGTRDGYHLDALELSKASANNLRVTGPNIAGTGPDMIVDSFSVDLNPSDSGYGPTNTPEFGPYNDSGFSLALESAGRIEVVGNAQLTNAYEDHHFALKATEGIDVILGEGSLGVFGPDNALGGSLSLNAPRIMVATRAAIADLAGVNKVKTIEERLAKNDGFASQYGALAADRMNLTVSDRLFVQNSGETSDPMMRNGLSFGEAGLNIDTANNASLLVINGFQQVRQGEEGNLTPIYGADAIAGVTINGKAPALSRVNLQSMMNGCLLVNAAVCGAEVVVNPPEPPLQDPINKLNNNNGQNDEEEEEVMAEERESSEMPDSLITASNLTPPTGRPLVIDPVTGAANDDMWGPSIP